MSHRFRGAHVFHPDLRTAARLLPASPLRGPRSTRLMRLLTDHMPTRDRHVSVGTLDLFHDEDLAYARRLTSAGVPCSLEVVDGAFHGFDTLRKARVSRQFLRAQTDALRAALAPSGRPS